MGRWPAADRSRVGIRLSGRYDDGITASATTTKQLGDYGWFGGNSDGQTQPVGAKTAEPLGLYDMHGNVWEWCQDWFDESTTRRVPTSTIRRGQIGLEPGGPGRELERRRRELPFGVPQQVRSGVPDFDFLGFRLARSSVEPSQAEERSPERRRSGRARGAERSEAA